MYSPTSSSESEYDYLCNNSFGTNSYWRPPFYPTLGQPLIYFAEIKSKKRSRRNRENEKNKSNNCFVKAFRWYTQEHVPFKKKPSSNDIDSGEMQGFATWLDEKYNEYLQNNQIEQNQYTLTQASTLQVVNTAENRSDELPTSKKFPSIMSPWKKRAKSLIVGSKNSYKVKSNQSIKVTLNSKALARAASASCQRLNSSATSDPKALNVKVKHVSKSMTSVLKDKEIYVMPLDALEDANHKDFKDNDNKSKRKERKNLKQIFPKESIHSVKSRRKKEVLCKCPLKNLEKIDSSNKIEKKLTNICNCEKKANFEIQQKKEVLSASSTNTKHNKSTTSVTALVSDGVQTSAYSINLVNETFHNHPLFVKIIHADKLRNQKI